MAPWRFSRERLWLSEQIAAALGLAAAIVMLGFVVGRFIAREKMSPRPPQAEAKG